MRLVAGAIAAALATAGCGSLFAVDPGGIAAAVTTAPTARGLAWTVTPWPLDQTVAWLCVEDPNPFNVDLAPPGPAACAPLDARVDGEVLTLEFDAARAGPALAARFDETDPPWFLAFGGRRGLTRFLSVMQVIDSPIPSDPGPS